MSIYFKDKTWEDIEAAVQKNAVILLPVGTTEEHGFHLPVGTDAIIARYFGDLLGNSCDKESIPVLVMETIDYGFSMGIVRKWPGCPNIPSRVFIDYIYNLAASLVNMGFRKIVMLDCHGNHDCLLRTVMREVVDKHNVYMMTLSPAVLCSKVYNEIKKDPEGDIHGGEYETSCILHIAPETVKEDRYTDVDKIRCNSILRGPVSTWGLQETQTGIFGDPTNASAETGRLCMESAAEEGVKFVKAYYEQEEFS